MNCNYRDTHLPSSRANSHPRTRVRASHSAIAHDSVARGNHLFQNKLKVRESSQPCSCFPFDRIWRARYTRRIFATPELMRHAISKQFVRHLESSLVPHFINEPPHDFFVLLYIHRIPFPLITSLTM